MQTALVSLSTKKFAKVITIFGPYLLLVSHCRSTIINLFRVPLNLVTVLVLLCVKRDILATKLVIFTTTSALALTAALAARSLNTNTRTSRKTE